MKRKILWITVILCLSVSTITVSANLKTLVIPNIEERYIELVFKNVSIDQLSFHSKSQLKVQSEDQSNVTLEKQADKIVISAEDETEIKVWLPEDKVYNYRFIEDEELVCTFSPDSLIITQNEKPIVILKDGEVLVQDPEQPKAKVSITKEGIFVEDEQDKVVIDSEGIFVQSDDDKVEISGPFGKLLGGFVEAIVNAIISDIEEDVSAAAELIINSDLTGESVTIEVFGKQIH